MVTKKPKFPALYRLRTDLTWEDVVNNWKEQKATPSGFYLFIQLSIIYYFYLFYFSWYLLTSSLAPTIRRGDNALRRPRGYWRNHENRRQFFIEMAHKLGFDPFKVENWEKVTTRQFRRAGKVRRQQSLANG